jgi:DNA-binding MarR family transcriptional regulator
MSTRNLDETVDALRVLRGELARRILARADEVRTLSTAAERLTTAQHLALSAIARGPLSTSELAAHTGVALSTSTRMIQGLERAGFVQPFAATNRDRRRRYVQATPLGHETLAAADDRLRARIQALIAPLTDAERAQLIEGVKILRGALAALPRETGMLASGVVASNRG